MEALAHSAQTKRTGLGWTSCLSVFGPILRQGPVTQGTGSLLASNSFRHLAVWSGLPQSS